MSTGESLQKVCFPRSTIDLHLMEILGRDFSAAQGHVFIHQEDLVVVVAMVVVVVFWRGFWKGGVGLFMLFCFVA